MIIQETYIHPPSKMHGLSFKGLILSFFLVLVRVRIVLGILQCCHIVL